MDKDTSSYNLILDSLDTMGIYVIREDDHRILYYNQRVKDILPDARTGVVCSELWKGSCSSCPLIGMGDKKSNHSFNYDGPNHKATDIKATRIMWEGNIPAFVVTFSPHAESIETAYAKIVKGNLTTNECEAVKMLKEERDMLPEAGFTLTMALESFMQGGFLYHNDVNRFREFSDIGMMSAKFKSGKKYLVCNYRRNTDQGLRWNSMEVVPDDDYTDDNQAVMIYVKDVQDIYHEGLEHEALGLKNEAILRALGKENFGIYLVEIESGHMDCIKAADEDLAYLTGKERNWDDVLAWLMDNRYHTDCHDKLKEKFSLKTLAKMAEDGKEKQELLLERRREGAWHYVSASAYYHVDADGKRYAILAFQDVDEHIRREISYSQSEKRMAAVIRSGYSRVNFVNLKTGICEQIDLMSDDSEETRKGNYEELILKAAQERVYGGDADRFLATLSLDNIRKRAQEIKDFKEEKISYRMGYRPPFQWLEQHIFYIRQADGVDVEIFGRDITEERRREEKQQNSAREKAHIINSLSSMFFSTGYIDLETGMLKRIVQSDDVAEVHGDEFSYAETLEKYADHFVSDEDRDTYLGTLGYAGILNNVSEKHPIVACEYREKSDKRDEERWIRASIVLADMKDGRPSAVLYVAQDITESKQKEMADRHILQDALETANFANATKSDFLSRMSHDIRTPMNAIIGMTAIAGTHLDDPQRVSDCLSKITVSGRHLLSLINEVLDISKIESGRVELAEEEFELSAFFDELITIILPSVHAKQQKFDCKLLEVEHEKVIGDSMRLQQVFINILSNAVKFTPACGKIELEIHEKPSAVSGYGYYEFVFRDNGIGMPEEYVKHIFEPFSRDESRSGEIEGTGLGMAIARNIVQMMNGDIFVKSEENVGSVFTVLLFLKIGDENGTQISELIDLPVLVADDDEDACEMTCHVLNELGMKGEWVLSGEEAVKCVSAAHKADKDYFAVILDWQMPGMDGIETARRIRADVGPDVPIIILSAYDWSSVEEEAKASGVNGFISKPLFKSRLMYLFRQFIDGSKKQNVATETLEVVEQRNYEGKRILLVEDNDLNREIAVEIIGMTGIAIDCAVNGKEALEMFKKCPPGYYDLIFMDIRMPIMNGYEATEAIRKLDRADAATIPIVAMSANAFTSDMNASKQAGMNEHIIKPLNFKALTACMDRWLGDKGEVNGRI